ncbi:Multidrug resistance-associated protein 1 [Camelus dromedarius]|uniref:Multidrug resistance-associated protein 1 n=1 Tax=Camelus dromedarius TaxID=9838 RepID=A0A5N4EKL8_CAMDR|nr:Multidrug resistance-associated protein 1 [Camelus dromedarius]
MFSSLRRWGASSSYARLPRGPQAQKCSPEKNASFFSKMTYSWFSRIIILGYKKPLEREDLFELNESDSSYTVCPIFEKQWRKEVLRNQERQKVKSSFHKETHTRKPSLLYALWNTFKFVLIQVALFKVFAVILSFTCPLIMKQMIIFCEHGPNFGWSGYGYALALFIVVVLQTLILQQYQRFNMLASAKIKTAVIGLIYKKEIGIHLCHGVDDQEKRIENDMVGNKEYLGAISVALLLSNASRKKFSTGEIINLMSADAQQLMDLTANVNLLWSAPFQILMAMSLIWQELGPAVLAGVAVLVFVIPLNAFVATRMKQLKKSKMRNKDKQIRLLYEILHGIKILKLYAWEPSYKKKVIEIREQELEIQKSAGYLAVFSMLTLTCIPFLVSLATFCIYFLLDEGNILTATKVFTSMSLFNILRLPLFDLPMVISAVVQTRISLGRLEDFLNTEELLPQSIETNYIGDHAIGFTNASFSWDKTGIPVLKDLNIKIPEGALVAVVGQVGSGKSSVLSAILGEMEKLTGVVQRKGSVAYVSQQAWIQNCILQENILFGSIMQKQFYERVLEACALLPDLEQLPNGDQTEIGERGVNISGGQKHRVSLARAVYSGADIYLLDDPLSAVDVHVGKQLFEKVIGSSGILKNKTRILVTHNLALLPQVDLIVVMESGRVAQMGTYQELLSKPLSLANLLQAFSGQEQAHALKQVSVINSRTILKDQTLEQNDRVIDKCLVIGWKYAKIEAEEMLWPQKALEKAFIESRKTVLSEKRNSSCWRGLFVCSGAYALTRGSLAASRTLHAQLLDNVLHLPLQFFETNPIGQIISRFTKDMFIIDIRFHYYLRTWVNCTLDVVGTILVIVGALPLFILAVIPLVFLYFTIQRYYVASSRQIRRLAGASRSPVISHFSETLSGVPTIRAFGHEQRFIQQNKEVVNENLVCFYNNVISNRWLSVRLEFLGNLLVFFAALLAVLAGNSIDSAVVGLSISYALNVSNNDCVITQSLNFWVRKACEIETNAVSIERVCEYENMDKEDPVLFSGTLQMNLDPLDKYSDGQLWEVLELCHLKEFVQSLPRKLLHEISEGGENLSVGQRQLICLARALLRKTKILILDEATASIDFETDNLVQATIRKEFSDCTILTIAHRLHSVMDSDRVLVLDSGRITEFETPQNLIQQKGLFFDMLTEAEITQVSGTKIK